MYRVSEGVKASLTERLELRTQDCLIAIVRSIFGDNFGLS